LRNSNLDLDEMTDFVRSIGRNGDTMEAGELGKEYRQPGKQSGDAAGDSQALWIQFGPWA
jgi:hypothetical protein